MVNKKADFRIQQTIIMILFVFLFFILVGLFFVSYSLSNLKSSAQTLQKDAAIASIETIANMPELNCDSRKSLCLNEDKLLVFASYSDSYQDFWPVASIKVYQVYPRFSTEIKCPAENCTYFEVYNSGQKNIQEYSTFVSICRNIKSLGRIYEECEIGRLAVGVKIKN